MKRVRRGQESEKSVLPNPIYQSIIIETFGTNHTQVLDRHTQLSAALLDNAGVSPRFLSVTQRVHQQLHHMKVSVPLSKITNLSSSVAFNR